MKFFAIRLPKISVDWEDEKHPPVTKDDLQNNILNEEPHPIETPTLQPSANQPAAKKKRPFWKILLGIDRPPKPQRSLASRLLGLKIGQFLNLFIWSTLIGVVMKLTNFNPLNPQFDATTTAGNVWQQGLAALSWAISASWKPALTGASIILPIWFCWRVITLPFRR